MEHFYSIIVDDEVVIIIIIIIIININIGNADRIFYVQLYEWSIMY